MAFSDAIDNGPRIFRSKLKFGHAGGSFPQQFRIFLNADLSAAERAFMVVAQLCRARNAVLGFEHGIVVADTGDELHRI